MSIVRTKPTKWRGAYAPGSVAQGASYGGTADTDRIIVSGYAQATIRSYAAWVKLGAGVSASTLMRIYEHTHEFWYPSNVNNIRWSRSFSTAAGDWSWGYTHSEEEAGWVCLGLSYDASSVSNDPTGYFNGKTRSASEQTAPVGTATTNTNTIYLGNNSGTSRCYRGWFSVFAVWDDILDAADFRAIAQGRDPRRVRPSSLYLYVDPAQQFASVGGKHQTCQIIGGRSGPGFRGATVAY